MTDITLRYNTNDLGTGEGHSIDDWKGAFFGELSKKCNFGYGSECRIVFFGDDGSYAAFEAEMGDYTSRNSGTVLKPNRKICPECEMPVGLPKW